MLEAQLVTYSKQSLEVWVRYDFPSNNLEVFANEKDYQRLVFLQLL